MAKQPSITAPIYGYNSHGLKHRASIDVLVWLDKEISEARDIQYQLNDTAKECDYSDHEGEIARHEQDGFVLALEYVKRYLERRD